MSLCIGKFFNLEQMGRRYGFTSFCHDYCVFSKYADMNMFQSIQKEHIAVCIKFFHQPKKMTLIFVTEATILYYRDVRTILIL